MHLCRLLTVQQQASFAVDAPRILALLVVYYREFEGIVHGNNSSFLRDFQAPFSPTTLRIQPVETYDHMQLSLLQTASQRS